MNLFRGIKTTLLIVGLLAGSGAGIATAAEKKKDPSPSDHKAADSGTVKNIGVAEFEKLRTDKKNVVLDVRTAAEFKAGHIPEALNIDWNGPDFEKKVAALDKGTSYLVHCAAGGRSAKAGAAMAKLEFKHLFNLEGGMKEWEKLGHKAEK